METFSFIPQYQYEIQLGHRVLITEMESGKEYRYYKGKKPREWSLSFAGNSTTITGIETFFEARKGQMEAFNWIPLGESTAITVRFKEPTLDISGAGMNFKSLNIVLREVL